MASKKEPGTMLTARVPGKLLKQLQTAARRANRTRTAELVTRLEESFKAERRRSIA
jgi:hypothetical protein